MRNVEKWSFRWQSCDMMSDTFSFCFYTNIIENEEFPSVLMYF